MKKLQFRQGDVFIEAATANEIPAVAKKVEPLNGRFVLAFGEVTGHSHSVAAEEDVEMFEDSQGTLWLKVKKEEAIVQHEEHAPIKLKKGVYRVNRQREWDLDRERKVLD